eukprot:g59639.t1
MTQHLGPIAYASVPDTLLVCRTCAAGSCCYREALLSRHSYGLLSGDIGWVAIFYLGMVGSSAMAVLRYVLLTALYRCHSKPSFHELKDLKKEKKRLLGVLVKYSKTSEGKINTVQKLKHLNGVIKNKVKELRNKKIEDLDQIVVQMKPKKSVVSRRHCLAHFLSELLSCPMASVDPLFPASPLDGLTVAEKLLVTLNAAGLKLLVTLNAAGLVLVAVPEEKIVYVACSGKFQPAPLPQSADSIFLFVMRPPVPRSQSRSRTLMLAVTQPGECEST